MIISDIWDTTFHPVRLSVCRSVHLSVRLNILCFAWLFYCVCVLVFHRFGIAATSPRLGFHFIWAITRRASSFSSIERRHGSEIEKNPHLHRGGLREEWGCFNHHWLFISQSLRCQFSYNRSRRHRWLRPHRNPWPQPLDVWSVQLWENERSLIVGLEALKRYITTTSTMLRLPRALHRKT